MRRFLDRVAGAKVEEYDSVGLGTEVRLSAPSLLAGGLVVNERVVHLAAFAAEASEATGDQRPGEREAPGLFARFGLRRRARQH